jgi:hypothetical protein
MSMGPPDEIDDDEIGPDDAAMPTRPSERGAWRHRGQDDETGEDENDPGTKHSPLS